MTPEVALATTAKVDGPKAAPSLVLVRPAAATDNEDTERRVAALCEAIVTDPTRYPDWWFEAEPDPNGPPTQTLTERLIQAIVPSDRLTLTVEETARIVDIGRTAAYEAIRRGDLPSRRINGRIVVPVPALLAWLGVECRTPSA